jgi:hypothetical protein
VASLCAANAPVSGADGEPRSDADRGPRPLHWRVRRHVDVHRTRNCRHVRHALARRCAPSRVHAGLTICLATPPGVRTVFCGTHDGPGSRGGLPGCCASSDADSRSVMPVLSHLDAAGRRTSSMLTNRCCPRASGTLAMRRTLPLSSRRSQAAVAACWTRSGAALARTVVHSSAVVDFDQGTTSITALTSFVFSAFAPRWYSA